MLTDDELAYMREVQAEHRPTPATLNAFSRTADGMGGKTDSWGAGEPIMVRIDAGPDALPRAAAARYEGPLAMITMDLIDVRAGSRITISATEVYQVVSEGDTDRWATAQQVVAKRIAFPAVV